MERHHKFASVITTTVMRPILTEPQRKASRLAANYLAFVQLASIRLWLRLYESATSDGGPIPSSWPSPRRCEWWVCCVLGFPHRLLRPAKFAEFGGSQRRFIDCEELVELRRLDVCFRKHGVGLPAMVDLVLKQVH